VRQRALGEAEHQLLYQLAGRISNRLEATFSERATRDDATVGVELAERGKKVAMEISSTLLARAHEEPAAREELRVRLKARRDRMLFKPPPRPLPKNIASAADPALLNRGSFGRPQGRGRR
jgi:hypothetical protein